MVFNIIYYNISINNSIKLKKQLAEIYILLSDFEKSKDLLEKVIVSEPLDKYLYGLPMKLNDPGTILDPIVKRKKFKGKAKCFDGHSLISLFS